MNNPDNKIPARILIVDDDFAIRLIARDLLTNAGFEVHDAGNGVDAIFEFNQFCPDIVLLDVMMPEKDGYQTCREIRNSVNGSIVPILMMTGLNDLESINLAYESGATDFITKPINWPLLPFRIHYIIRSSNTYVQLKKSEERLLHAQKVARIGNWELEIKSDILKCYDDFYALFSLNPNDPEDNRFVQNNMLQFLKSEKFTKALDVAKLSESTVSLDQKLTLPDHSKRYICIEASIIYDINGIPTTLTGTVQDISERKLAEKHNADLEAQLHQAMKMESIGRLAGGVAHDFNNMLNVIIGHTDFSLMKLAPTEPLHEHLSEIRKAAERSAKLTRQLLAFARKQTITPTVLELNSLLSSMINMLKRLIGANINLNWSPGENVWLVKMDPSQLEQILTNLCINARDAIHGSGSINISTGNRLFFNELIKSQSDTINGEYVWLSVSDDGCGMDDRTLNQIFEPFFTTKDMDKGTGLGLAMTYGAVKQNNGFIEVSSQQGDGTTLNIYLPRHLGEEQLIEVDDSEMMEQCGTETILLVEDEDAILKMTTMMLELQGYTVLPAGNATAAVRLAGEHAQRISLLITDVILPEANGRDLARQILSTNPKIKCLFMSGYTADIIAQQGIINEGLDFLQKPFSINELSAKVRQLLDA